MRKEEEEKKSMSIMIILEETNSQMVPSVLSKRKEKFLLRSQQKLFFNELFHDKNDQFNPIISSILSQRWDISILNDIGACIYVCVGIKP